MRSSMEMESGLEVGRRGNMRQEDVLKEDDEEDDDHQREGTVWSAASHCITAVIGSGVLALAWSVAQLGWIVGPITLICFSAITYYTSILLADCYRSPHPETGSRNRTYMNAVKSYLGHKDVIMCAVAQYANLWGALISYTITSAMSMMSFMRSNCYHNHGRNAKCGTSGNLYMVLFGVVQIVLSLFPNMEKITWLSVVAAVMSFAYSLVSLFLCLARWISHGGDVQGTLWGTMGRNDGTSSVMKTWKAFQALGNIGFAYTFAEVLIEIQDTLKSPPSENKTMKKANMYGTATTTIFYISLGCIGYAAFGNDAPGNILTGFYEPFWIVDIAHISIIIHLVGAYQVYGQPIFAAIEKVIDLKWPEAKFMQSIYTIRMPFTKSGCSLNINLAKLFLRSIFIIFTTLVSMLLPFFNAIMGLLGAASFCSLTVYFPVKMHMTQTKVTSGTLKWFLLHGLCLACFLVSIVAAIGSVADIVDSLKGAKPFHIQY